MDLLSNLPSSSPLLHAPSSSPSPKSRVRVSQNLLPIRPKPSQYFPISSQNRRRMEPPTTVRCSCQAGDNGSPTGCRIGEVARVTKETDVQVRLNLDGTGIADSSTGIPFLDHMLDQLASHGLFDVHVKARGDIHIDDHHTNEDVALAIGTTLLKALGDRKGINRFGDFTAPLDEALVHVALDLSGRPHLSYDIDIPTERVGTYDTQLVEHFFQSLVNTSGMTLHIRQLAGRNSHHIIEATFKAFARALRQATEYDVRRRGTVPRCHVSKLYHNYGFLVSAAEMLLQNIRSPRFLLLSSSSHWQRKGIWLKRKWGQGKMGEVEPLPTGGRGKS